MKKMGSIPRLRAEREGSTMTLTQKRRIVERFMAGQTVGLLAIAYFKRPVIQIGAKFWSDRILIESVLRSFLNGEFTMGFKLAPERKRKR